MIDRLRRIVFWIRRALTMPVPTTLGHELLPLALPLMMYPWLLIAIRNYVDAEIFRDANMFSYAAYCFRRGERMYRDFATPDGPLSYLLQAAVQIVWGTSTHQLRVADLELTGLEGAAIGTLVVPRARDWIHGVFRRTTWAVVGACVWCAQMLSFDNPATLQRESYYVGIGCIAIALAYGSVEFGKRTARAMLAIAGFLSAVELFGKHSGVIYLGLVGLTVWLARGGQLRRGERVRVALAGMAVGVAAMIALVAIDGSLRGFGFFYFRYNFAVYKFMFRMDPVDMLVAADRRDYAMSAALALLGGVAAIRARAVTPAIAGFAVGPVLHLMAAIAQMRGWRYHYIPVQASSHAAFLAYMAIAWCAPRNVRVRGLREVVAIGVFVFFAYRIEGTIMNALFLDKAQKFDTSAEFTEPHKAAEYLAMHTRSTDRVFYYGGDPGLLFEAKRLPATPYIVAWLVEFRNALTTDSPGSARLAPDPQQRATILALEANLRQDDCSRVLAARPPALVFMDMGAIGIGGDPRGAVESWCPTFHEMVDHEYHHGATIGRHAIYLRNDRN